MMVSQQNTLKQHGYQVSIAGIIDEVKQNGFFASYCACLVKNAESQSEMAQEIKHMAKIMHLKVRFNPTGELCIFEMEE